MKYLYTILLCWLMVACTGLKQKVEKTTSDSLNVSTNKNDSTHSKVEVIHSQTVFYDDFIRSDLRFDQKDSGLTDTIESAGILIISTVKKEGTGYKQRLYARAKPVQKETKSLNSIENKTVESLKVNTQSVVKESRIKEKVKHLTLHNFIYPILMVVFVLLWLFFTRRKND